MTNENVRIYPHDRILDVLIVRYLPRKLLPNHITLLRFFLTPFVLWCVNERIWSYAIPLFLFAAFTDALDGSMARLRKQITMWGTIADPIADKLLISSLALLFVIREVDPMLAVAMVVIEVLIMGVGVVRHRSNSVVSANWAGKTKMLLQVIGIALLLLERGFDIPALAVVAVYVFLAAIGFALVSLVTYSL